MVGRGASRYGKRQSIHLLRPSRPRRTGLKSACDCCRASYHQSAPAPNRAPAAPARGAAGTLRRCEAGAGVRVRPSSTTSPSRVTCAGARAEPAWGHAAPMTTRLEVALLPSEAAAMEADAFLVIDVLRATTAIATLFARGLSDLLVVDTIEAAREGRAGRGTHPLRRGRGATAGGVRPRQLARGGCHAGAAGEAGGALHDKRHARALRCGGPGRGSGRIVRERRGDGALGGRVRARGARVRWRVGRETVRAGGLRSGGATRAADRAGESRARAGGSTPRAWRRRRAVPRAGSRPNSPSGRTGAHAWWRARSSARPEGAGAGRRHRLRGARGQDRRRSRGW